MSLKAKKVSWAKIHLASSSLSMIHRFLAKGSLKMVVRDAFTAIKGFVSRDMYISLVCASGKINFAPNHPLACLLKILQPGTRTHQPVLFSGVTRWGNI